MHNAGFLCAGDFIDRNRGRPLGWELETVVECILGPKCIAALKSTANRTEALRSIASAHRDSTAAFTVWDINTSPPKW